MPRPLSDIDLRRMDAGEKPRRRRARADRKKPDPPANLKASKPAARAFADTLPVMPGVIVEIRPDCDLVDAPHNDVELWNLQLVQAFGTRSYALLDTFLQQLAKLCPQAWDEDARRWKLDETEWNALVALVADWQPQNSGQAALAAQMAATHMMVMRLSAQALNRGHSIYQGDAALASKLARTFTMQVEAMQALKGKSRSTNQSIHVHKETHHHVHQRTDGGGGRIRAQSHDPVESCRTIEAGEAMRGKSPIRQPLPSPSREGQRTVQVSRRKSGRTIG